MRQQITVSVDSDTGPVFHGASGALYGLSDDGVPGADLLAPLRVRTVSQKPPGGLQHPGGDADQVAAGENTITFGNPSAYAPDIDKITVAPAVLP